MKTNTIDLNELLLRVYILTRFVNEIFWNKDREDEFRLVSFPNLNLKKSRKRGSNHQKFYVADDSWMNQTCRSTVVILRLSPLMTWSLIRCINSRALPVETFVKTFFFVLNLLKRKKRFDL